MSLWKENTASRPTPAPIPEVKDLPRADTPALTKSDFTSSIAAVPTPRAAPSVPGKESLIASDITIEGKIEGGGSVRIAGKFKGDVNVQGDVTIEAGAKLTGSIRADKVTIAGELEGNVDGASRVDLLQTGSVIGDLKTRSLAVAAGASMRGKAEFGGEDGEGPKVGKHLVGMESGARV
jgi:cytoskeletal protein CcmA (bactofilin family)